MRNLYQCPACGVPLKVEPGLFGANFLFCSNGKCPSPELMNEGVPIPTDQPNNLLAAHAELEIVWEREQQKQKEE